MTKSGDAGADGAPANRSAATSQLIIDIAGAAAGERDLDHILHETLDRLRATTAFTGGSIALVQGDELVIRAAVGPFASEALGQRLKRGPSASWRVIETLEPCLIPDMHAAGITTRGAEGKKRMQSWLAVPIIRRARGIGLLEIDATSINAFSQADVELLETVVRVLSGPVELAALHAAEVRASELRDAFIGVISHELRTPITTIYGLSKMLRQRGASLDGNVVMKAIEDIEGEADRLQRLVEDLLSSRGPSGAGSRSTASRSGWPGWCGGWRTSSVCGRDGRSRSTSSRGCRWRSARKRMSSRLPATC